ncbi:EAL domain-containing protein [Photobacterium leiognathi]|uniref:EAL domain-containing protein n=1 Tax=Photobacterium leiognathi TaxID=553611 RepID=UPI001EDF11D1|nr:EAL domain-containing protein [Photobacterium leiognathi]MCG3884904.1 EAL domain-containing protein [Photobacterium leiognathi]
MQSYRLQPIIKNNDGSILYKEMLTNFYDINNHLITTDNIIKEMEISGGIINFDLLNLKQALRISDGLNEALGVNISARTIGSNKLTEVLYYIKNEANEDKDLASKIVFEIKEYSKLQNNKDTITNLELLKAIGFKIAADDFGNDHMTFDAIGIIKPDFITIRLNDINANIATIVEHSMTSNFEIIIENIIQRKRIQRS